MFNNNNFPTLNRALSLFIVFILAMMILFSGLFISLAIASIAIVPITWIWGLLTGQSYERVCDNSEIIYKLNQLGKWSIVIGISVFVVYLIYLVLF
jgi:hypothetical protein